MKRRNLILAFFALLTLAAVCRAVYSCKFAPARILVVNAMAGKEADFKVNNTDTHVDLTCVSPENLKSFSGYDAVILFGRSLYLDSAQMKMLETEIERGVKVYTYALRNFSFDIKANLTPGQIDTLNMYAENPCGSNCRNMLLYMRRLSVPDRLPRIPCEAPVALPKNMYYHIESGKYFTDADSLTAYLKNNGMYNPGGKKLAFISGTSFPVEGNRPYIDTLISELTKAGHNVYPLTATGKKRAAMLRRLNPDGIVYLPMGRIGNDTLVDWLCERNIPLFAPFPFLAPRSEWLDVNKPLSGGVLNARILIPEVDGGIYPVCIATQNPSGGGVLSVQPEPERVRAFVSVVSKHMALRTKPNRDKHIAIGYFRNPGKDALLASGLEVIPSLYRLLRELAASGYDVSGLPDTEDEFASQIRAYGRILGDYASGAQREFMDSGLPVWVSRRDYELWAREVLLPSKYNEVTTRYGIAPGRQMARGDSVALSLLRYGNIILFPQPRPALGNDDFKMVHGAEVPPPHNYIATYLYIQKEFDADALIHFGTHGNLEFTPGKNAGLSQADWAEVLVGPVPHFYLYVTSNTGEAVIAKRRSHAVMITHLTAPFVESGMRARYKEMLDVIHMALGEKDRKKFAEYSLIAKKSAVNFGLHRILHLDSLRGKPYAADELEQLDMLAEEVVNEKITGANYVLGTPYSPKELNATVTAICADRMAYENARRDRDAGKITTEQLQSSDFVWHRYLPAAKQHISAILSSGTTDMADAETVTECRDLLKSSPDKEIEALLRALNGGAVAPAPGGDPVQNANVLPTGRNMYSVNTEATPTEESWKTGVALAKATIEKYRREHNGEYPQKINYIFWAGEFIASQGATIAQAMYMLGVEPLRDSHGRVVDLKLIPAQELGRPRIDIVVQVSGQLRDIAGSRLKLLTDAVKLAAEADDGDLYANYVAQGSLAQEKELVVSGTSPAKARELGHMRIFGPVNSGYGTGMLPYAENSGEWDDEKELVDGFLNNMCAIYGDEENWGKMDKNLFRSALKRTNIIVQPRQSNTWGPVSLDHVYEFTGSVSMAVKQLCGSEPDAVMADYRNSNMARIQDTRQAVAVETKVSLLNPDFIRERMKGGATTASAFGEMMRNIFGWTVLRKSVLDESVYHDIYRMYIDDCERLGIREYFERENPAAYQEITAIMLESARKGYWKPASSELSVIAELHAALTDKFGAPCTEFVCGNAKLQDYIASNLDSEKSSRYKASMQAVSHSPNGNDVVLAEQKVAEARRAAGVIAVWGVGLALAALLVIGIILLSRYRKSKRHE